MFQSQNFVRYRFDERMAHEKLDRLKKSGAITDQEFARLRAKLVQ
jgi:hypothetical protein